MTKVSIITPTFNHAKYIRQCIESVISQTFSNWELLVIDDASTDANIEIINEYVKKDERIKLFIHKKRYGIDKLVATYNEALSRASGEYVAVLEGDDWWPKDKLERQVTSFKRHDVVLSFGDAFISNAKGRPVTIQYYSFLKNEVVLDTKKMLTLFSDLNFYLEAVTVMIRKSTLDSIGGFKKNKFYPFVDFSTWIELSLQGKFTYLNCPLGYYRRHSNSSWYSAALGSKAMLREEMQLAFSDFLHSNRGKVQGFHITEDSQSQLNLIKAKSRYKNRSLFLHTVLFGKLKNIKSRGKIALRDKELDISSKIFISAFLLVLPLRDILLCSLYFMSKVVYELRRKLVT